MKGGGGAIIDSRAYLAFAGLWINLKKLKQIMTFYGNLIYKWLNMYQDYKIYDFCLGSLFKVGAFKDMHFFKVLPLHNYHFITFWGMEWRSIDNSAFTFGGTNLQEGESLGW